MAQSVDFPILNMVDLSHQFCGSLPGRVNQRLPILPEIAAKTSFIFRTASIFSFGNFNFSCRAPTPNWGWDQQWEKMSKLWMGQNLSQLITCLGDIRHPLTSYLRVPKGTYGARLTAVFLRSPPVCLKNIAMENQPHYLNINDGPMFPLTPIYRGFLIAMFD